MTGTAELPPGSYCRRCDLFTGYNGAGVARMPDKPHEWLMDHCWLCERSRADIAAEVKKERRGR